MLETEYTEVEMRCVGCQAIWSPPVARQVNVGTHPDARLGILLGTMHRTRCPVCKRPRDIDFIFDYYDPDRNLIIQVRPEWEFHAGGGEDWYWTQYEYVVNKYAEKEVKVDVVFGFKELIEKYLGGDEAVAAAKVEWEERVAREIAEREAKQAQSEEVESETTS